GLTACGRRRSPTMRNAFWAGIIVLLVCASAKSQETRGKILGTVQDPQGGAMPSAVVKITNVDTQTSMQVETKGQGYFEAPLLNPGNYSVSVEMQGFKTATRSGVQLAVAQQVTLPFTLEIGELSQSVEVAATAPLLD